MRLPGGKSFFAYPPIFDYTSASKVHHSPLFDGSAAFLSHNQRICFGNWVLWRHRNSVDILCRTNRRNTIIRLFSDGCFTCSHTNPADSENMAFLVNCEGQIINIDNQVTLPHPPPNILPFSSFLPLPPLSPSLLFRIHYAVMFVSPGVSKPPRTNPSMIINN